MLKRFNITITNGKPTCAELAGYELPEWKFSHQDLIDLVQAIKDYTYESGGVLGYDEREASEFVDIFLNGRNRTPIAIEVEMERVWNGDCFDIPATNPDGTVKGRWVYE